MKIGVTFCQQLRLKMKGKDHQCISIILPLLGKPLSLTVTSTSGFRWGRRPRLVSRITISTQGGHMTGTMAHIITVYFARRQEWMSASMHHIVLRIALACAPNFPSRMEWADPFEVGLMMCNNIRSMKTNGRRSWNPLISKKRCYIALPRSPACAVKSRRSRRSGNNLQRRHILPERIGIMIIH